MIAAHKMSAQVAGSRKAPDQLGSDPRLSVTVVFTTPEATLAALKTADELAKSLAAGISLIAIEVVPFQLPLDKPAVPVDFRKRRLLELVSKAGADADEVSVEICLCRERRQCLQQKLRPRSLVVIGGKRRWWSRERKLQQWLDGLGHRVVFVDISRT